MDDILPGVSQILVDCRGKVTFKKTSSLPGFGGQKEDRVETHHLFSSTSLPSPPQVLPFHTLPHFFSSSSWSPIFLPRPLQFHSTGCSSCLSLLPLHTGSLPPCSLLQIFLCSASQVSPLKPHFHVQSIFSLSSYYSALN